MFDFDAGKLLIVGVIALIFIPPKDLPRALRQAGQLVGKMRRMAAEFRGQFMDAMHEADMADVRREAQKLADAARVDSGLSDVAHTMTAQPKLTEEGGQGGEAAKGVAAAENEEPTPVDEADKPEPKPSGSKQTEPASHPA